MIRNIHLNLNKVTYLFLYRWVNVSALRKMTSLKLHFETIEISVHINWHFHTILKCIGTCKASVTILSLNITDLTIVLNSIFVVAKKVLIILIWRKTTTSTFKVCILVKIHWVCLWISRFTIFSGNKSLVDIMVCINQLLFIACKLHINWISNKLY